MTEEDKELELLKAKRMLEMQKNISQRQRIEEVKPESKTPKASPRDIVLKQLGYRGEEVLQNAESQFPTETKLVVEKLAELIQGGEITEIIDGGKLLTLFRSVGIHVRIQTTISVEQDGKMVSWSDKLKGQTKSMSESAEPVSSNDSSNTNI
ncbi:MAG: double-stranded DNA-binding protein [Candidatus Nitrosotalea sp.]|nr:double-stranded DNA-binding protein [Candidatus Nitrosotalea sp.]